MENRTFYRIICMDQEYTSLRSFSRALNINIKTVLRAIQSGQTAVKGIPFQASVISRQEAGIVQPILCVETNETFPSILAATQTKHICRNSLQKALKYPEKTALGCHWKYLNPKKEQTIPAK